MEVISVKNSINQTFQYAEAFKTLRTNLMFSGPDIQTIALTSDHSGEGKSTVSFQLAASLAQSGKTVMLLDTDLRKSQLAAELGVHGKILGLSHFLSGQASVDEVVRKTDVGGLYILFAGAKVPNAAELLGLPNFEKLITESKKAFDYVIVDCAPLGLVIDSAVISPHVDGMLIVIDSTNNNAKRVQKLKSQLDMVNARILGAILTKTNGEGNEVYYGGKRSKYGYGYGYGNEEPRRK